jgi:hypothetical protein
MIVRRYNLGQSWQVYHQNSDGVLELDQTNAKNVGQMPYDFGNDVVHIPPTATEFTVGTDLNYSGNTFIAYLFASDAGGFGDDGDENIIKCGSFTNNSASVGVEVNCGFEPQWLLIKGASSGSGLGNWVLIDSMRGASVDSQQRLYPNASTAEGSSNWFKFTSQGFTPNTYFDGDLIYIAIRRPMKTPESGTEVFGIDTSNSTGNAPPQFSSSFPVDMAIRVDFSESATYRYRETRSRLVPSRLKLNTTDAEVGSNPSFFAYMDGCYDNTTVNTSHYAWMFKRATGFFDVVAGNSDASGNVWNGSHNLGVNIEFAIVKNRQSNSTQWWTAQLALGRLNILNQSSSGSSLGTDFTTTTTTFKAFSGYLENNEAFVMYAFATLAGVSKVGSYTGTAADLNVDCGFSAGARFILIKRTDSTGDWYVWDSERGITVGNDPYFLINSTAAEVTNTDYIDPLNAGFTVTSSAPAGLNASGGTYIFLAIA